MMMVAKLPDYDSPPAVEILMGFYFAHFSDWNVLHFGKLWSLFEEQYPKGEILPPLMDQRSFAGGDFEFGQMPLRAMFTDTSNTELLQVQPSAFLRNWRKTAENQPYTHYANLKPKFQSDWRVFSQFLAENHLPPPQVFQCEVAYINHLVRGVEWDSYSDLAKLLKPFAPRAAVADYGRQYAYLPEAAAVGLNVGYNLTEAGIALQISCLSAIRKPDGTEVIQLSVTAKGDLVSKEDDGVWKMLDQCHDAVILAFDDVTTDYAHEKWGKR
jgi:uncharacterized protein (TIGR04255 family)